MDKLLDHLFAPNDALSLLSIENAYRMDETLCLEQIVSQINFSPANLEHIHNRARDLVIKVREKRLGGKGLDAFLVTYDLASDEGIALMCLAEALLRIPDNETRDRLIRDKIADKDWLKHLGWNQSLFVNAATFGLMLTGKVIQPAEKNPSYWSSTFKRLLARGGEPLVREALNAAMKILGRQFVMGETISAALNRAKKKELMGYRYSYDMLGEAAKTKEDAEHYFNAYQDAIAAIEKVDDKKNPIDSPGISIKLSALHPRYEWNQRDRILNELFPKLKTLVLQAKEANINLTIDAEEAERLTLSLILFEKLIALPELGKWEGLGLAVQAYQKRSIFVIDWLLALTKQYQRKIMLRLVKGAYWDSEIKWTQEKGLSGYPVFTRKSYTDVCFLACAKKLFLNLEYIYPQFATHNAYTVAAILEMASEVAVKEKIIASMNKSTEYNIVEPRFEFQCLHGMGESLYDTILQDPTIAVPCRVYAPVGGYQDLLPYLVRRLLENGSNTSFVNRIIDRDTPIETIIADPIHKGNTYQLKPHPDIPLPKDLFQPERPNSRGVDLSNSLETVPLLNKVEAFIPGLLEQKITALDKETLKNKITAAHNATVEWSQTSVEDRTAALERMAGLLEESKAELLALLIREGGKSVQDAISEVRESIDYCNYYSYRAREDFKIKKLKGPTGEDNQLELHGRGVVACISPWNFPLAIFLGQITAALAAGNTVLAKPASQTPLIAAKAIDLLHEAGIPKDVVQLLIGSSAEIGDPLIQDLRIQAVMLTGSTSTARHINQQLANRSGPIIPFIAETGGQNVMLVDSSALPEQVVTDVITSAFNSAGQRCSALRVLFLQEEAAPRILTMLKGAMAELIIGDPLFLSTDIGPVIDEKAKEALLEHVKKMKSEAELIAECKMPSNLPKLPRGAFFAPIVFQIDNIAVLPGEVFGPILHVVIYKTQELDTVLESINATGYGLTLGIHSRVDETIDYIHNRLRVGNAYVNRNMIGAVVGVQPFGGEGLSGTGPKAGGPYIIPRLAVERTLSVNTTASGGNVALMQIQD